MTVRQKKSFKNIKSKLCGVNKECAERASKSSHHCGGCDTKMKIASTAMSRSRTSREQSRDVATTRHPEHAGGDDDDEVRGSEDDCKKKRLTAVTVPT